MPQRLRWQRRQGRQFLYEPSSFSASFRLDVSRPPMRRTPPPFQRRSPSVPHGADAQIISTRNLDAHSILCFAVFANSAAESAWRVSEESAQKCGREQLSADDGDAQLLFFLKHGYHVIARDRAAAMVAPLRAPAVTIWTITPTTWRLPLGCGLFVAENPDHRLRVPRDVAGRVHQTSTTSFRLGRETMKCHSLVV